MVLIIKGSNSRCRFIVLHGRDEDLRRPATDASLSHNLICGRDLQAKGTWAGLNVQSGNCAALTNGRDPHTTATAAVQFPLSRGALVMDTLLGLPAAQRHLYGPFNLVHFNAFDPHVPDVHYMASDAVHDTVLQGRGVHALSNSFLNDMTWPKVCWLRTQGQLLLQDLDEGRLVLPDSEEELATSDLLRRITGILSRTEAIQEEEVQMEENKVDEDSRELPEREIELRRTVFIRLPDYGTRSQTAVIGGDDYVFYLYRRVDENIESEWKIWKVQKQEKL